MAVVLYIHGFLSSPLSTKAQITQNWLAEHYPDIRFECPALSANPRIIKQQLDDYFKSLKGEPIYAIGSSLGGFWSTYFTEQGLIKKTVLVNPAVSPHERFNEFVGQTLSSYYSDETYVLDDSDLRTLKRCDCSVLKYTDKYWLMVQEGDEALDYRLAVNRYKDCKQTVEAGGNHSFEGYEHWLPNIMTFFDLGMPN